MTKEKRSLFVRFLIGFVILVDKGACQRIFKGKLPSGTHPGCI